MASTTSSVMVGGPTLWYMNVGDGKSWLYLGMAEGDTSLEISQMYEGIATDGSGRSDFDRQWMGSSAGISADLADWQEPVLDRLKAGFNDTTLTPGQWPNGSVGTMLKAEGKAFSLCIVSQYATKDVYAAAGAHPVWLFPLVFPLPMRRNLSTRATRERIAFEAVAETNNLGAATLYYNSISFNLPVPT